MWAILDRESFESVDISRTRTDRGHPETSDKFLPRLVGAAFKSGMRTDSCHAGNCGLNVAVACLRTRILFARALLRISPRSSNWRVCGHRLMILRARPARTTRPIRGHKNVPNGRGRACLVLNMMRNTLSRLPNQFAAPTFQLRRDDLNLPSSLNCPRFDTCGILIADLCFGELQN